ncbi:MAG TPA: PEP-CTERM sorting domain-containing protein [Planctomycetota bacterium]|nr:PEP-CTERM sorting domain-containing protein [Planctomycetota bacterium]
MRFASGIVIAAMFLAFGANVASADSETVDYPSSDSTVVASYPVINGSEFGYFWSGTRGDRITETFTGTGLDSVYALDLDFDVTQNVLNSNAYVDWNVFVNGTAVGGFIWSEADGTGPAHFSYSFAPIVGNGTYTISMEVANDVPSGYGSIAIGYPGTATLTGTVPEPASLAMLGIGIVGVCLRRRRKA